MSLVYISGPITGIKNYNADAFCNAERELCCAGFSTKNPLRINDVIDYSGQVILTPEAHSEYPREYYLKRDIIELCKCDRIFFLEGWQDSKGALFERSIAKELNIPELFRSENKGVVAFYR